MRQLSREQLALQAEGAEQRSIEQAMTHQLRPVLRLAAARWHLLNPGQALQQALVQHIGADAQQPLHQTVLAAGQPQVLQAGVVPVAAHRGALARH